MKMNKGEIIFYVILVISLIMVNPPVLSLINQYAITHPITCGYPTLWIWLELWYAVMIIDFLVAAIKLKSWQTEY